MLRTLLTLTNERVLKPFDVKIVRRSKVQERSSADEPIAKRVIFFHPPKCGGKSVNRYLAATLGGARTLRESASEGAAHNLGIGVQEVRETILAYEIQRRDLRYISGHYPYSRRALAGREGEFDLVTVLRNPLDRMLSLYYFNRFKKNRDHFPIECDLPEWLLTRDAKSAATIFVRMFVGDVMVANQLVDADSDSQVMDAAVDDAIGNLRKFAIVGVLESIRDFENAVRQRYGVRSSVAHHNRNPNPGYPAFDEQPEELQSQIRDLCQPDMKIYRLFSKMPQ